MGARVAMTAAVAATLVLAPAAQAAFPGRDGLIAFTRAEGSEHGQLYLVRPDGSGLRRITHRRHGAGGASWSPDGRRILFSSTPRRGGVQVFVKRLGGGVRQLTRGRDTYAYPAWSPSGKRIVAVRGHVARDGFQYESVVTMRADGSRKRAIYSGGRLSTSYPAWSPDGRSIAFVHTDIGGTGADPTIYVVPAAGGAATQVTDVGSQDQPDWSPDGRLIAYAYGSSSPPRRSASSGPTAPATRRSPAAPPPRTRRRPGPRAAGAWRSHGAAGSGRSRPTGAGCGSSPAGAWASTTGTRAGSRAERQSDGASISRLSTLPVGPFGSSSTNQICRGYL